MKLIRTSKPAHYKGRIHNVVEYSMYLKKYILKKDVGRTYAYLVGKSDDELIDYIVDATYQLKKYKLMNENKKTLTLGDIRKLLRIRLPLIKRVLPDQTVILLTYSHDKQYWVNINDLIGPILSNLMDEELIDIKDISHAKKQTVENILNLQERRLDLIPYNPAPDWMIKFNNQVFNNKLKIPVSPSTYNKYHFTKANSWDLKPLNELNPVYVTIINRIMCDWSCDNKEVENLLWQIIVAAIEGNGRNKVLILKSDGGGGKTSFQTIIKLIVGLKKVLNCGIYELNNDNKLAGLSLDTHLIMGDDADTNKKMPAESLSRLKSLSDGGSFLIDVKYEASRPVMSNALFIQNTNTDIAIYENTPALQSRLVKIEWTNRNFRQEKDDIDFDLKELLGNPTLGIPANEEFIEAFISLALNNTPYFKTFTIPKSVQEDTNQLLNENDQIQGFDEFLESQNVYELPYLNISSEHKRYEQWLLETNASAKPLKIKNFEKEMDKKLSTRGYVKIDRRRPSSFSKLDYNINTINSLTEYNINEKQKIQTKFWFNSKNVIKDTSINYDELDNLQLDPYKAKDIQLYYYLAQEKIETIIIDKYMDMFED